MRRLHVLTSVIAYLFVALPAADDSALAVQPTAPLGAQTPAPEPVLPGAVALIQDEADTPGLPRHFRMMSDPFPAGAEAPLPSRAGLDALRASGSAEFSAAQLEAVVERVGRPLIVVDLRLESHGFLAGLPVSWFALHDQVNVVRSLLEVQQDERRRLDAAAAEGAVPVLVRTERSEHGTISAGEPATLPARPALTERELVAALGLGYFRVPATDYLPPTAENVDRFVAFAAALPPETWLHVHCHAGDGRTTTFLAIWDMMHNAGTVSVDHIVRRQALIGPLDLFHVGSPEDWRYPFQVERVAFIRRSYEYARANTPTGFIVPWSVWSATRL